MSIRLNRALCAALFLGFVASPPSGAQSGGDADFPQNDEIRRTGIVESLDGARVVISGEPFQIPALTPIREPSGHIHHDPQSLGTGMHVEFTGEPPAGPDGVGIIKTIRIIPN
ncbi:hypothetical protein E6C76_11490 [Pseudothauera nasutitermitis]|uniref:DUF5666 domain-containing protein n=1 Tax=Pseudothauera nasutitermitis TaxID=2565930 RepID=A0A4V3WBV1_9RHOO|nr:hypothetical protein [Pseudothauera nasutitermitis]THF64669.1 hypothetical protein E6C76_11490 [Pseudothauera nasutitermitis]